MNPSIFTRLLCLGYVATSLALGCKDSADDAKTTTDDANEAGADNASKGNNSDKPSKGDHPAVKPSANDSGPTSAGETEALSDAGESQSASPGDHTDDNATRDAGADGEPASSSAGTDPDAGAVPSNPDEPASPDESGSAAVVLRTCTISAACSYAPHLSVVGQDCADKLNQYLLASGTSYQPQEAAALERAMACAASETDCDGFTACASLGSVGSCNQAGSVCDGDLGITCKTQGDNVPELVDCAAVDGTCTLIDGSPFCGTASDCEDSPATCDGESSVVECKQGFEQRYACPEGSRCLGGSCAFVNDCTAGMAECDGDDAVRCSVTAAGALGTRQHCADIGKRCEVGPSGPECVATATDCDPLTFSAGCEQDAMTVCIDGVVRSTPCEDFGAGSCSLGPANTPICLGAPDNGPEEPTNESGPADPNAGTCLTSATPSPNTISETQRDSEYPEPQGGPLIDGLYYLSNFDVYSPAVADEHTRARALEVVDGRVASLNVDDGSSLQVSAGTIVANGTEIDFSIDCPEAAQVTIPYTQTPDQIWLFDPTEPNVQVYTRQQQ
jgi:hypothetical protein